MRLIILQNRNVRRLLAAVLLAGLFFFIDIKKMAVIFGSLSLGIIAFLVLISCALVYVSAMKWGVFLRSLGVEASIFKLNALYLVGYFVNTLLPSFVGGDVVRSLSVGKHVGKHEALAATVLERYTGLLALVVMGVLFIWFAPLVTMEVRAAVLLIAAGLAAATAAALSVKILEQLRKIKGLESLIPPLFKIQAAFRFGLTKPSLFVETMALSVIFYLGAVVNTLACAYAVGWFSAPVPELFVVLPIILILGALPISPSGLGIQEGAFFYFLQGIGASPEQALGVALLLRAKTYVLAVFGWLVWALGLVEHPSLGDLRKKAEVPSAFD